VGLRIECPNCGSRPYTEYWYGGELPGESTGRDPLEADYERVWLRRNTPGRQTERWFHYAGCRRWLTVERDTRTNEIHAVA
jgi:heterotetrameric sarcosine oxidase delta subunit